MCLPSTVLCRLAESLRNGHFASCSSCDASSRIRLVKKIRMGNKYPTAYFKPWVVGVGTQNGVGRLVARLEL